MSKIIEVESCAYCSHLSQDYDDHDNAIHICTHPNKQMIDNRIRHIDEIDPDCPLADKDEWIPVSERLPEKGKCVQIWREGLSIIPTNAYLYEYWINNTGLILDDVTHWQPLPEPPKSVKP